MKATLTLDNKEYKVDLNKLIQLGLIEENVETFEDQEPTPDEIESFEVGDVFHREYVTVLIIQCTHPNSGSESYQIAGLNGLEVYSDYRVPMDYSAVLRFLNKGDYKLVKNINKAIKKLINDCD
jgi:hypothetical protein